MIKRFLLFFFALGISCAEAQDTLAFPKPDATYLKSGVYDLLNTVTFPAHISKKDVPVLVGGLTAPLLFLPVDEIVTEAVFRNQKESLLNFCNYGLDPWGSGLYSLPVFGIAWFTGTLMKDERTAWAGLQGGKTTVLAMVVSRIPKYIFQRHRPDPADVDAYRFEGPFNGFTGNYSFPSGHTFVAFSAVSSIAPEFRDKPWLVAGMYTLASAVGAGRIYQGEHWLSDVAGGAAMGYLFGRFVWKIDNWKVAKRKKSSPSW